MFKKQTRGPQIIVPYVPRRYHTFRINHALPGHVARMMAGPGVVREVLEADADLARALRYIDIQYLIIIR